MRRLRWTRLILLCIITPAAARYECDRRLSKGTLSPCFIGHHVFARCFHSQRESVWRPPVTCDGARRFFLSPVVENRQSFFALASTNWQHELAGLEVT